MTETGASNIGCSVATVVTYTTCSCSSASTENTVPSVTFVVLVVARLWLASHVASESAPPASCTGLFSFRWERFRLQTCRRKMLRRKRGLLSPWRFWIWCMRGFFPGVQGALLCRGLPLFDLSHFAVTAFRWRGLRSSSWARPCLHLQVCSGARVKYKNYRTHMRRLRLNANVYLVVSFWIKSISSVSFRTQISAYNSWDVHRLLPIFLILGGMRSST